MKKLTKDEISEDLTHFLNGLSETIVDIDSNFESNNRPAMEIDFSTWEPYSDNNKYEVYFEIINDTLYIREVYQY